MTPYGRYPTSLGRIVEDDPEGVTSPAVQSTDAMAKLDPVDPACTLYGSLVYREDHCIALP